VPDVDVVLDVDVQPQFALLLWSAQLFHAQLEVAALERGPPLADRRTVSGPLPHSMGFVHVAATVIGLFRIEGVGLGASVSG